MKRHNPELSTQAQGKAKPVSRVNGLGMITAASHRYTTLNGRDAW
jgi:hypothetical protein